MKPLVTCTLVLSRLLSMIHSRTSDAFDWSVLSYIRLTEEDTTSSSRIFIKILFREMSEILSLQKLKDRLEDPSMVESSVKLFQDALSAVEPPVPNSTFLFKHTWNLLLSPLHHRLRILPDCSREITPRTPVSPSTFSPQSVWEA